jgi:DNA invertase Pin-like site-specific DNA recombinase
MGKHLRLSRGQVAMYLSLADGHRTRAAELAGVSRRTFLRAMAHYRVRWPRSDAKLNQHQAEAVRELCEMGVRPALLAQRFGVQPETIRRVVRWETWYTVR